MKYLFVIAHADPNGQTTAYKLANTAKSVLETAGSEVKIVDLIQTPFLECASAKDFKKVPEGAYFSYGDLQKNNNVVDCIKEQQALITWCTHLIVFGPMWFLRLPSIFYSWVERVFTSDWSWELPEGVSPPGVGKKALFVITTGAGSDYYGHGNGLTSLDGLFYSTTFELACVGFEVYRSQGIWDPRKMSQEEFDAMLEKFGKAILNLENRPLLKFNDKEKPEGVDDIQRFAELANLELE